MSQLTIKLSAKADALIAQLQKEIFNRRRKKITAAGVVESLVESGAKSQSDKRYSSSWKNLIKDIEKAAKVSEVHGNKPANVSADEWAMILSHRTRKGTKTTKESPVNKTSKTRSKASKSKASKSKASKSKASTVTSAVAKKAVTKKAPAVKKAPAAKTTSTSRPARRARKATKATKATPQTVLA
ncbi:MULTISPECIES: hypothetical protein [Prochlorococcus]|nr:MULTISPECIES: hypothetical protein [Prochlorococcus]KGG14070.1 putative protein family PM-3 [Prochlorococcus marinus str. LG]KGG19203.1 putative protein family PM-3 [Prochlorococcus marinus str. SS2]KGG25162.1 putative protein family PM-3 [Prochlorococcus marinus str. SS35]KGG33286.1 putative protein family PM-3 [Prochlorococcus marinus str. SS51]KGG35607.1 putative protein family PM-3 [Prochlorococcus sp. SS52]